MFALGIRAEVDDRNEKVGYKIRESQVKKVPYSLVVGDKEMETNTAAVREYGHKESTDMNVDDFIKNILQEISTREDRRGK